MRHYILILLVLAYIQQPAFNANCFDYSVTQYQGETYNDNGFTTYLVINPTQTCDVEVFTGIARFVYEAGITVKMYSYNSLGQPVYMRDVGDAEIIYWYLPNGSAPTRKFTVINSQADNKYFRITIQKLSGMLELFSKWISLNLVLIIAIILAVLA